MSATFNTLAHLLMLGDRNISDAEVSEVLQDVPFLNALFATTASNGTQHSYNIQDGAPVVGFRAPNAGRDNTGSTDKTVTILLKILDASFNCDKAVADVYPKGGATAYVDREGRRALASALKGAERQMFYGVGADADGFVGMNAASTVQYKNSDMVVDATGSTSNTGSSVWMIRTNSLETDMCVVAGQNGRIDIGDTIAQQVLDGDGKPFTAYHTPIVGWLGLQVGSKYSMGRICNLTAQSGKGLTDDLLQSLWAKFPDDREPTMIVMNKRSLVQLWDDKKAASANPEMVPMPTSWNGIPIVRTSSISSTEAIVAASA